MENRILGRTGLQVSTLGFGGAEIGFQGIDLSTVEKLLGDALDAGLTVIDTGECYKDSEELIGKAVSHRRSEFSLFTKIGHGSGFQENDWDLKMLEKSIDRSLKRLNTDYVDLLQLHSCPEEILRRGEVIELLGKFKQQGKTRFIGCSGDGQAALYAVRTGLFDTLQTSLSIADQEAIELTIPEARQREMGVIAKRPLANAAWRTGEKPADSYHHEYWERLKQLRYHFLNEAVPEAVAYALRFTLSVPGVHTAIVGTTRPGRWEENAAFLSKGPLPIEAIAEIRGRWQQASKGNWPGLR
ncbi:aldo/keto reductase [Paenibacillus sp. UNC499MF]|uniref:aldo/keto reductase n=1 Tax=Paenibacillus sp. UNC499MF TaxID=1502751 RepID=UPI00089FEA2A|nr:aldo/keto reductase [Paenibacillus sp. UNC499MF]SEG72824.1 Predicted oxidoreductase [Paenibacillus sp. UNC499MF]